MPSKEVLVSKSVEVKVELVENDAGDIVMRLKDAGQGAITFHRGSGASGPKAYEKLKAILESGAGTQPSGSQS
jgi:hypothetical protein